MRNELQRRLSNADKVEALFRSRIGEWIEARDFEEPGGRQAWRTRISQVRRERHMHIENREERNAHNEVVGSWYRYLEHAPIGRDPQTPHPELSKHPPSQLPLLERTR